MCVRKWGIRSSTVLDRSGTNFHRMIRLRFFFGGGVSVVLLRRLISVFAGAI